MNLSKSSRSVSRQRRRAWALTLLLVAVIYTSLPIGPRVWSQVVQLTGTLADDLALIGLLAVAALAVARLMRHRGRYGATGRARIGGLLVVAGGYAWALAAFTLTAAERLHFLYYGLLGYLALRALAIDLPRRQAWYASVALAAAVGLGDELIQGVLSNRFFEWKDVLINALAGVLAVAACALLRVAEPAR